jgi:hypothetical protein
MVVCENCGRTMKYSREDALYVCPVCKTEDTGEGEYYPFPSQDAYQEYLDYELRRGVDDNFVPEDDNDE